MQAEIVPAKPPNLWQKITALEPNRTQLVFDIIFGIVAPITCFIIDAFVFSSQRALCPGDFLGYAKFVYCVSGLGMAALVLWLMTWSQLKHIAAFLVGVFAAGSLLALVIGLVLLIPASLSGFFVALVPLFAALVFGCNSRRAWKLAGQSSISGSLFRRLEIIGLSFILVFIVSFLGPLALPKPIPAPNSPVILGCI